MRFVTMDVFVAIVLVPGQRAATVQLSYRFWFIAGIDQLKLCWPMHIACFVLGALDVHDQHGRTMLTGKAFTDTWSFVLTTRVACVFYPLGAFGFSTVISDKS